MVERVERVMRIKRVRFNNDELFERRKGFEEREKDESFSSIFEDEVEKKKKRQMRQEGSETAYHLEIGRATQSLLTFPMQRENCLMPDDLHGMRLALEEAKRAYLCGEVPIGAVILDDASSVISSGYNLRETEHDATAHAELIAIRRAVRHWDGGD